MANVGLQRCLRELYSMSEVRFYDGVGHVLQNEVGLLRNEVTQLKQLLLAHKDCPVTAMQKKAAYLGKHRENTCQSLILL